MRYKLPGKVLCKTLTLKDTRYDLAQAVSDFGLNNLAEGLEESLTQNISYDVHLLTDLDELCEDDAFFSMMGSREHFFLISAKKIGLQNPDTDGNQVEICLDKDHGELIYNSCSCSEFMKSGFSCRHIHTLLMAGFLKSYGADGLRESDVAEHLRMNTGVSDPFLPGILKKTDPILQHSSLLRNQANVIAPIWVTDPKNNLQANVDRKKTAAKKKKKTVSTMLSVETILLPSRGKLGVELKVGPEHHYIIRNLDELMEAYMHGSRYAFGKNNLQVGREHVTLQDQPLMDYFSTLYQTYYRSGDEDEIFTNYSDYSYPRYQNSREKRYFYIMGRDLDVFMDLMEGRSIAVEVNRNSIPCKIDFSKELSRITLEKEEYGATIRLNSETVIGCGAQWMYLRQNDIVYRLPVSQWEERKTFAELAERKDKIYVQDKDLPALVRKIASIDPEGNQFELKGEFPVAFQLQKPEIELYLDYPQGGLVSCEIKASYHNGESGRKTYSIFDQKTDENMRDLQTEQQAGEKAWGYFNAYDEKTRQMFYDCDETELYLFLTETIPMLSKIGQMFVSDRMKSLKVRPVGEVNVGIQVMEGNLLMSLKSATMDRQEIIEILSSYSPKKHYTRLKNGTFITFDSKDAQTWETIAETFRNYGRKNPDAMKVPMFRALYLQEMLEDRDGVSLAEDKTYQDLIRSIKEEDYRNYEVPESLDPIMRGYQKDGFRWIKMLKSNGFGGILADDMGLGKTLQVLSFLLSEKEGGKTGDELRTLIVTPASLVYNWKKEIETFTPGLSCQVIAGGIKERKAIFSNMDSHDVYITSYDLLKRDIARYEDITFANEIIDEAQFIKNQNTQAARGVRVINSGFRMALTGTPIENRLSELWSIYDYLMPGFLYKYTRFRSEFEIPVIQNHDESVMNRLRSMVHPFLLRRLKKDVLKDLPDKIEETVTVELSGGQRKIYDAYAERLRLYLENSNTEEFAHGKIEILAELTKLRQICCGPEVFLDKYKGENAKKEACMELVHQAVDGGHKLLLFSQFTKVLDELCASLSKDKILYHRIDGSTSKEARAEMVESFAEDSVPVFCISLKAGGTGLNLTAADIVIHYDPWWNLAAQNQATDRTHRIGQKNTVVVYQLIAEKTIEQEIVKLQKAKAQLAEDVLSGEGIGSILIDKEELLRLLM